MPATFPYITAQHTLDMRVCQQKCVEVCLSPASESKCQKKLRRQAQGINNRAQKRAATLVAVNESDDFSRVLPSVKKRFVDGGTLAFDGVFTERPHVRAASGERRLTIAAR